MFKFIFTFYKNQVKLPGTCCGTGWNIGFCSAETIKNHDLIFHYRKLNTKQFNCVGKSNDILEWMKDLCLFSNANTKNLPGIGP